MQNALDAVETVKAYYKRLRSDEEFDLFYDGTLAIAVKHKIGQPQLYQDINSGQHVWTVEVHSMNFQQQGLTIVTFISM